jgi:hypothetical protein
MTMIKGSGVGDECPGDDGGEMTSLAFVELIVLRRNMSDSRRRGLIFSRTGGGGREIELGAR